MSMRIRILLVALLPLLAFVVQSARLYRASLEEHDIAESMHENITVLDSLSLAVHELQKERGISSLYASGGTEMAVVSSQRSVSDRKLKGVADALAASVLPAEKLADARKALEELPALRASTDAKADPASIRKGYTGLIKGLLGIYRVAIAAPSTKGIGKVVTSFAIVEEAKEATGRLRALTSSLVALDKPLDIDKIRQLMELHAAIEGNLGSPGLALGPEAKKAMADLAVSQNNKVTEKIFWTLIEKSATGGYGITGKECFDAFTLRINDLQEFLRPQYALVEARALELHDGSQASQYFAIGSALGLAVLLLGLVVVTVRDLRRRVGRLNEVAERVARGDLREVPQVTGNDEFDRLMRSMGSMVERIGALLDEIAAMSKEHDEGEIDRRIAEERFEGAYRSVAESVNGMVAGHIAVKKKAMACVKAFGEGDFDASLERFPGKKAFINDTIEQMRANLKALIQDASMLSRAAVDGKLSTRADASRHKGDFARIVQGVNDTLDAVIGPLNVAAKYVDLISKGDVPPMITDHYNGDFNALKQNLNTCIEAVGKLVEDAVALAKAGVEGRLETRADASRHSGDFARIVQGVNDTLDAVIGPVTEATQVLERVAERDLTVRVQGNYAGDLGRIKSALNTAVSNLETALGQVGDSASQVAGASGQISSGSQSLAQGANEQASSLEEVSASLEEMAGSTRQNADNAMTAKQLAAQADANARTGIAAMTRMSESIQRIKAGSDQTAKIIKTIDEIAMQTNLLALNAAVEAARAGEAGRGFAVVAEEVRNLAQRSAQAAKNTAEMIGESVKNAEEGVKISVEVAGSFDLIANGSKKVNDLIGEIASASKEQSVGIKEINDAVGQMDKVTQQNAANAQESASASEELSSQAEELQAMVRQFRISARAGAKASGPRPKALAMGRKLSTARSSVGFIGLDEGENLADSPVGGTTR